MIANLQLIGSAGDSEKDRIWLPRLSHLIESVIIALSTKYTGLNLAHACSGLVLGNMYLRITSVFEATLRELVQTFSSRYYVGCTALAMSANSAPTNGFQYLILACVNHRALFFAYASDCWVSTSAQTLVSTYRRSSSC